MFTSEFRSSQLDATHFPITTPMVFERPEPPRWVYTVLDVDPREEPLPDEARLNALGSEGWLLLQILHHPDSSRLQYVFARAA